MRADSCFSRGEIVQLERVAKEVLGVVGHAGHFTSFCSQRHHRPWCSCNAEMGGWTALEWRVTNELLCSAALFVIGLNLIKNAKELLDLYVG